MFQVIIYLTNRLQEYYFIGRENNKHVKSKLYNKYRNIINKAKAISSTSAVQNKDSQSQVSQEPSQMTDENSDYLDERGDAEQYLRYEREDWNGIENAWRKTITIRKESYRNCSIAEINRKWPLFLDPRAPILVS